VNVLGELLPTHVARPGHVPPPSRRLLSFLSRRRRRRLARAAVWTSGVTRLTSLGLRSSSRPSSSSSSGGSSSECVMADSVTHTARCSMTALLLPLPLLLLVLLLLGGSADVTHCAEDASSTASR